MLGTLFISNGRNGGGGGAIASGAAANFVGQLSGAGTVIIVLSDQTNPQQFSGTANTFSGQWILQCGWLKGVGANSLGTNSITADRLYVLQDSAITTAVGAALFEVTYDLNSAGVLTLTNGGKMNLHQNCCFNSVVIEGTSLSPGTHSYSELAANFPNNIVATNGLGAVNGSGTLTVQPYGTPPALVPTAVISPVSLSLYPGQTGQFTVAAAGNPPLSYQWRQDGTNLADGATISGSTNAVLTITNAVAGNAGTYDIVVTNAFGAVTSAVVTVAFLPPGTPSPSPSRRRQAKTGTPPIGGLMALPASVSAVSNPGSPYEVLANHARLRTPASGGTNIFPGDVLTVDGDGVWHNDGSATIGEIRFKNSGSPDPCQVTFKRLVMKGGQLDASTGSILILAGEMDILTNTPLYTDTADASFQIDAWLTGSGSIQFHANDKTYVGDALAITGTSNTFSGTWDVVQGILVGVATNSLGTNNITVELWGALETLYDVYNPSGSLGLNGQMYLHQNDTFQTVTVAGTPLPPGTFTFAELSAAFPAVFPATWTQTTWSSVNTGSGSITVLSGPAPPQVTLEYQFSGSSLQLSWSQGMLLQATNVAGPYTPVPGNPTSSYTVTPTEPQMFFRLLQMQ